MEILKELDDEHRLIEDAMGSFVTLCHEITPENFCEKRDDIEKFTVFFTGYLENFHFKKEEEILFQSFMNLGIPEDKGPLYYYILEHTEHVAFNKRILNYIDYDEITSEQQKELIEISESLAAETWEHIDKEDSVLYAEVSDRIRGKNATAVKQLNREFNKTYDVKKYQTLGEELVKKYKPTDDLPDVIRGDGCMSCRHFGEGCDGIEHEWWSEHEWEDFYARNNRD